TAGPAMAKLIIGCGYLGWRVARLWQAGGERVFAVTRSAERAASLAADGLVPIVADVTDATQLALPQDIETVLWAVGHSKAPTAGQGSSIHDVYVGGLANALRALPQTVGRFLYIS